LENYSNDTEEIASSLRSSQRQFEHVCHPQTCLRVINITKVQ